MPFKLSSIVVASLVVCAPLAAQEADVWSWALRTEVRANYRWSEDERITRPFPPPRDGVPTALTTVDPGSHVELNVADVQFDLGYGKWVAARAKVHAQAKHRRNPTTTDRQVDADELWIRVGEKPEFLARPEGTSFFVQAGKFPKMERQPIRLLESYGVAATSFNRFEDVQLQVGGTVGRNFYWRAQVANGNPLFIRDPNALAGDNGTPARLRGETPELGSGFPILYNAETEDLVFDTSHMQTGEALGYRWQRGDESLGFDFMVFHYQRDLADTVRLTGTAYGGDLDVLVVKGSEVGDVIDRGLPIVPGDRNKEEFGARLYSEWGQATINAQMTWQKVAGLEREGWELEAAYRWPLQLGAVESIQPAVRVSNLDNHFVGHPQYPATSVRWDWRKYDAGVRVGLKHGLDVTFEYATHDTFNAAGRIPIDMSEALVTVRWKM